MVQQAINKVKSKTTVHEIEETSSELYKVGLYTSAAFAVGIGAWGLLCLVSAFVSAGGPVVLAKGLFGAIFVTM